MGADDENEAITEEQIIGVLKEAEAGAKTKELIRKYGISEHARLRAADDLTVSVRVSKPSTRHGRTA